MFTCVCLLVFSHVYLHVLVCICLCLHVYVCLFVHVQESQVEGVEEDISVKMQRRVKDGYGFDVSWQAERTVIHLCDNLNL